MQEKYKRSRTALTHLTRAQGTMTLSFTEMEKPDEGDKIMSNYQPCIIGQVTLTLCTSVSLVHLIISIDMIDL
jgi:hypothetical protein